jgi:hypothetical protein
MFSLTSGACVACHPAALPKEAEFGAEAVFVLALIMLDR